MITNLRTRLSGVKSKTKALFITFIWGGALWAQDSTMIKKVTVLQEFNPTVNDASKIDSKPQTDRPEVFSPHFEYHFFNTPLRTQFDMRSIKAEKDFQPLKHAQGKPNYIKGGVGNYFTLFGELYYNAYHSDEQKVNIFYRNRSSWGKVTLQNNQKVKAPSVNNYGKVDFQRRYRYWKLNAALTFDRKGYEHYGYHTLAPGEVYLYRDDTAAVVLETGRQILTNIGFDAALTSLERRGADLKYSAGFSFNSASNDHHFSENEFIFKGRLEKTLEQLNIGVDAVTHLCFYGDAQASLQRKYEGENYFRFKLAPYAFFQKENWDLKAGMKVDFIQVDGNQEIIGVPMMDFNFNIVPKYFTGYLTADGGINPNTYADVTRLNPFVTNDLTRNPTRTLLDVSGGFTGHPTKELSMKLGFAYQMVKDQLFFVNEFVRPPAPAADKTLYTNRFAAEYDDNNTLAFRGELSYNTYRKWSASLAFDYYNHQPKMLPEAWHLPNFKISTFGHYDLSEKIRLKGTFDFLPERPVKISQSGAVAYLPVTYDVSLNGEYKFRDNWSFFLDINNLLGSQYYHFNGYPAYRINALLGATFRF